MATVRFFTKTPGIRKFSGLLQQEDLIREYRGKNHADSSGPDIQWFFDPEYDRHSWLRQIEAGYEDDRDIVQITDRPDFMGFFCYGFADEENIQSRHILKCVETA